MQTAAKIYLRRNGAFGASCDGTQDVGCTITEDSGRFTVVNADDELICRDVSHDEAEAAIAHDWRGVQTAAETKHTAQTRIARSLCRLLDDEWSQGRNFYMKYAAGIMEEIAYDDMLAALKASDDLLKEAQGILEAHLYPDSPQDADQTVSALLELLDGPKQREVQKNTRAAISKASGAQS